MPHPTGLPYTPAVAAGDWVVVSGQLGLVDGVLVEGFAAEVDAVLANLRDRLAEHGLGLEHVVKTTCFLADLDRFGEFNERYALAFAEPRPARSAFQVARLPFDANVEIEAWAYRG
ncbi:RidA family protein [Aquihabitans sp. McL0605]|uniref:RidA family protein n=1 Tax=Aquihabitans sp. McL0605 TaxID=3415671 RepID=UPI003CEB7B98